MDPNIKEYYSGIFTSSSTGKDVVVFLHEAEWVINTKKLIPKNMLIAHKNGDIHNNNFNNLYLVKENNEFGDLHKDRIFHEDTVDVDLIKEHFDDIYRDVLVPLGY